MLDIRIDAQRRRSRARTGAQHFGFQSGTPMCRNGALPRLYHRYDDRVGRPSGSLPNNFTRAYDSIKHTAVMASKQKPGVPLPLLDMYLRELRRSSE